MYQQIYSMYYKKDSMKKRCTEIQAFVPETKTLEVTNPQERAQIEEKLRAIIRAHIKIARTEHGDSVDDLRLRHFVLGLLLRCLKTGETNKFDFSDTFAGFNVRIGLKLGGTSKCQKIGLQVCSQEKLTIQEITDLINSLPTPPPLEDRFSDPDADLDNDLPLIDMG